MIRKAAIKDLPELLELTFNFHKASRRKRWATFENSSTFWEHWLLKCMEHDKAICLVSEEANELNAFCTAILDSYYWNQEIKGVQEATFWVEPAHRKKGIGSALLQKLIDWGEEKKADVVTMGSNPLMNPKAMQKFLRKHGFVLTERRYFKDL